MREVYKLTIYVTPEQWDCLSAWSAPGAVSGGDRAPWLHLEHESGKYDELVRLEQSIKSILKPHDIQVSITPPIETAN